MILKAFEDLLEVAEDMHGYAIAAGWEWKYGKYWNTELEKAKKMLRELRKKEQKHDE